MSNVKMVYSVELFDDTVNVTIDLAKGLTIHEIWTCLSRAGVRPSEVTVGLGRDGELARVVLSGDRREQDYYRSFDRLAFVLDALGGTVRHAHSYT